MLECHLGDDALHCALCSCDAHVWICACAFGTLNDSRLLTVFVSELKLVLLGVDGSTIAYFERLREKLS